jgi:hypothetical protein|tara:strand:- start:4326 stop:4502 length:177 start_codon:yes stop_codon:yes gene_type:complete
MPGMIDGHSHPGYIELEQYGPISYQEGPENLLTEIKEYEKKSWRWMDQSLLLVKQPLY